MFVGCWWPGPVSRPCPYTPCPSTTPHTNTHHSGATPHSDTQPHLQLQLLLQDHRNTLSLHYCTSISPPLLLHGHHKLQHSLPSLPRVHTDPDRRIISDSATSTHNQNLKHARLDYLYQTISISFVFSYIVYSLVVDTFSWLIECSNAFCEF